jgi:hypothetical protein
MKLGQHVEHFKGRHFDRTIIVLCERWYLRYKLSFRDVWTKRDPLTELIGQSSVPASQGLVVSL